MKSPKGKRSDLDLVRICKMYYLENYTQEKIAKLLGISRPQVSRLLSEARNRGLVEIRIREDELSSDLGSRISRFYGLKEVVVVDLSGDDYLDAIAKAGAAYLEKSIRDGMVVGVSWGRTLARTVEYIVASKGLTNTLFVPLLGGVGQLRLEYQVNALVEKISDAFGSARYYLHAPAFLEDPKTLEHLLNNESVRIITNLWNRLNLAVVGIGEPISLSNAFRSVLPDDFVSTLISQGAVGDIAARFFREDGSPCELDDYQRHILGVTLEQLKNTPCVIGIAGGKEKVKAICGAMRGKYIKVLITDSKTAREIVRVMEQ